MALKSFAFSSTDDNEDITKKETVEKAIKMLKQQVRDLLKCGETDSVLGLYKYREENSPIRLRFFHVPPGKICRSFSFLSPR